VGSGKSYKDRPGFKQMLDDLREYKYDGIVVFRLDRLFRNVVEAVNLIQEWDNKGIEIYSINENLDTSTAIGRAMRDIILVLAKLERENISEATKARLQALKDQGVKLGRPAISEYQVKRIKELRSEGLSYRRIADEMNIKKSTVAKYCKSHSQDTDLEHSEKGGSSLLTNGRFMKCPRCNSEESITHIIPRPWMKTNHLCLTCGHYYYRPLKGEGIKHEHKED
jgi:DNA invertase Pin-like site-specific DNA recombinase